MIRNRHTVQVTLALLSRDYRSFVAAARLLVRIMGAHAPTLPALIELQLKGRDATGVADDYLDSVGWPRACGRVVSLRQTKANRAHVKPAETGAKRLRCGCTPVDPSRN